MKREDVKAKLPGITDEQLNWLMSENGADINREKTVAEQFKTQLENARPSSRLRRTASPSSTARRPRTSTRPS